MAAARFAALEHEVTCVDNDRQKIELLQPGEVREQISLVLQDSLLSSGTIRDNIVFGQTDATDEEISAAGRTANADEFIRRLPDGYDTRVGERGTTLSGGQKRIVIARAVRGNAPILIANELTSGLDAAAEHTVISALERAGARCTTLVIAHRPPGRSHCRAHR